MISSALNPSRVLGVLSTGDLRKLRSSLPGVPVSGSKAVRIQRIIGYFANLITKEVSDEASPGERFYKYLPELARRDRENLLANQIIRKDLDIEHGFEAATRFLSESRLGLKLMEMTGSEHPDGCIRFGRRRKAGGDVLMWDNKSTETAYTFPPSHLRQFKREKAVDNPRVAPRAARRPAGKARRRVTVVLPECSTLSRLAYLSVAQARVRRHPMEAVRVTVNGL